MKIHELLRLEHATNSCTHHEKDKKQVNPHDYDSHNAHETETCTQITEGFGGCKSVFITASLLNFTAKIEKIKARHKINACYNKINQGNERAKSAIYGR